MKHASCLEPAAEDLSYSKQKHQKMEELPLGCNMYVNSPGKKTTDGEETITRGKAV